MFLKNRNISSKIKRSKVTDYAAINAVCFGMRLTGFNSLKLVSYGNFSDLPVDKITRILAYLAIWGPKLQCRSVLLFQHDILNV